MVPDRRRRCHVLMRGTEREDCPCCIGAAGRAVPGDMAVGIGVGVVVDMERPFNAPGEDC